MTQRLYHEDAYLRRFDAEVVGHSRFGAKAAVLLDRTAFYPESGGQLGDHGLLGELPVVDTQELDGGVIAHVLDAEPPPVGSRVTGELAWPRRRQHMAQHTAQHLLSGALLDRTQSETVSSRLGESALTIDLSRDRIPEAELDAAEALANDLIDDDLPVRAWFPEPGELVSLALRRAPKVTENIRVVAIGDFDVSPCGGTHCLRTSQLGALRITGVERYKGMTRVTFTAARRGREELFARDLALRGLASELSCAPSEVATAVERLRRDIEAGTHELGRVRAQLANSIIDQLSGSGPVIRELSGDVELLRNIAAKLTAAGRDAILCTPIESGTAVVLMRAAGSTLDCARLWKQLFAAHGGRGGGKAERAEGKLTNPISDWPAAVARSLG
jgi:alanyl-tRNA synthetase